MALVRLRDVPAGCPLELGYPHDTPTCNEKRKYEKKLYRLNLLNEKRYRLRGFGEYCGYFGRYRRH